MPGFALAKACAAAAAALDGQAKVKGMVLLSHGLFTFSDDARESYERMIELVGRAEDYLRRHGAWDVAVAAAGAAAPISLELSRLRRAISAAAGRPVIIRRCAIRVRRLSWLATTSSAWQEPARRLRIT